MTREAMWWIRRDGSLENRATGLTVAELQKGLLQDLPEDAMPARPRGDAKERTFNLLIRDGIEPRGRVSEQRLIGREAADPDREFARMAGVGPELQGVFGEILDDHYVIEGPKVRFLFPFHSSLPGALEFQGRYKMFNGKVLAFLCQRTDGQPGFNRELIQDFYELFNDSDELTLLDEAVLGAARAVADEAAHPARADVLIERHYGTDADAPGMLMPEAHRLFQRDLATVLGMTRLNRRDRVNAAINVFYVHLALYFQRLAWLLEEEFAQVRVSSRDQTATLEAARRCFGSTLDQSPFAGSIRFRVGSGNSHSVRMTDGFVASYDAQNRRQLLLPANLSVLGAARAVMVACGQPAGSWSFYDVAAACRDSVDLRDAFDEAMTFVAERTVGELSPQDQADIAAQIAVGTPGLELLREAVLKTSRSALRRHGRDIVHFLVLRGGRGYISRRGRNIFYFEVGQDLLLLLSKAIVRDRPVPFREFLKDLRAYGLEPYSRTEQDRLAESLRGLNLLEKHSDAGEAMYVKHFL